MPKVNVGDLVCLYRRKNKGLGIVLEKIDDMNKEMNVETPLPEVVQKLNSIKKYYEKTGYREQIIKQCDNPEAAKIFFMFNGQGWCSKAKYKFARVRWFKQPSAYESVVREEVNWCPEDWLKKV